MFRALLCPSSGAPSNYLCSLWLPYDCRVGRAASCGRFTDHSCKGSWRGLLMMGITVPETCWAVSTRQSNKYKIDCASTCLFYWIYRGYMIYDECWMLFSWWWIILMHFEFLKTKAMLSFDMPGTSCLYPETQLYIPQDQNPRSALLSVSLS
jgi:hypothetical protein